MKAATLTAVWSVGLALTLAPAPASARGWFADRDDCAPCTRQARGEYAAELCRARRLQDLDCAGLARYAESGRMAFNRQILAAYNRPQRYAPRPAAAPPPLPTIEAPATPPPQPPVPAPSVPAPASPR